MRTSLERQRPFTNGQGRIIHWFGINIDIDERRRAQQQLRQKEEDLQQEPARDATTALGQRVRFPKPEL